MAACETDEVSGNIVDAGLGTDAAVQQPSADMMNDAGPSRLDGLVPNTGDECTPDKSAYEQTIRPILTARCGHCHGETLQYGAVGHLLDYDSLISGAANTRPVDKLAPRVTDGTMPPAGNEAPTAAERLAVAEWATCGAWTQNNATLPNPGGFDADRDIAQAPEAAPADADFFELRANAFHVAEDQRDHYECFYFELPVSEPRYIKRIETVVDDARVLHHTILIPDGVGEPGTSGGCDDDNPLSLIYGWAPGQGALQFEEGGMLIEPGQRVTLQIHYNNGAAHPDVFDSSGIRIYHQPVEGPEVSMLTLGPIGFGVPANTTKTVDGWCRVPTDSKILYSFPHMHENGTAFNQVVEEPDGSETSIISLRGWDFGSQFVYQTPVDIPAGTVIRTSCTYQNTSERRLRFGPNTRDEMCFNFAYVSPPLPISFCNQSERPEDLVYEAGECAAPGSEELTVVPVYAPFFEGTVTPLDGGPRPEGRYVLAALDIYLPSFDVAGFELDTDLSRVTALGTAGVIDGVLYIDAKAEVQLVAGGLAFNPTLPISFAGTLNYDDADSGAVRVDPTCGELLSGDQLRYGYADGKLKLQVPARIGPTETEIVVHLKPVMP